MTDTKKLRKIIEAKGLKLKFIARKIGISPYSLTQKIENDSQFKVREVDAISEILELTLEEKDAIFFAH